MILLGTFARVWLAQLSRFPEDKTQIYALKILRKADGEYPFMQFPVSVVVAHYLWLILFPII